MTTRKSEFSKKLQFPLLQYCLLDGVGVGRDMRKDGIYMYKENRTKTLEQKVLELQCIVLRCLY